MQTNSRCLRRFRRAAVASRRPDRGPVALRSNATTGAARLLGVDAPIPTADPAPLWDLPTAEAHVLLLCDIAPQGPKPAPARTASLFGDFRTGESVVSRRPLVVVADPVGGVYVGLVVSCNQEPAAFRLGLAQAQCNVFIMVYYSVRPTWAKACARAYAISLPRGL